MIITTANLYLSLSCPHPPSQMGLPNGMAQGVYFRGRVCRKKKSVGILDFGKVPRLGFIFFFFTTILKGNQNDIKSISGFKDGGARVKCMPLCVSVSETKIHESE